MKTCVDPGAPIVTCCMCGENVRTCESREPYIDASGFESQVCPVEGHQSGSEVCSGVWVCSRACSEDAISSRVRIRAELVALVKRLSIRRGDFELSSGGRSDLYVDMRQTTLHARGALLIGALVSTVLLPEVVGIGGMTLGADPIVAAVAVVSESISKRSLLGGRRIHGFLVRKEVKGHGMRGRIEGLANLPMGSKVAVVEDTTTTGNSMFGAIDAATEAGLDVVQAISIFDRLEHDVRARADAIGIPYVTILTRSDLDSLRGRWPSSSRGRSAQ